MSESAAPFKLDHYVDLSHVRDPRLRNEIHRTLEYFASKPEGQKLIRENAASHHHQRISFTDHHDPARDTTAINEPDSESRYDTMRHNINISEAELRHTYYYTTAARDKQHIAPYTLGSTLWHEMEHGPSKTLAQLQAEPDFKQRVQILAEKSWSELEFSAVYDYALKHPDAVRFRIDDPALRGKPLADFSHNKADGEPFYNPHVHFISVDGKPLAEFKAQMVEAITQIYTKPTITDAKLVALFKDMPAFAPSPAVCWQASDAVMHVKDRLFEDPVIAKTNEAMKLFYPTLPPRVSHDRVIDLTHDNPVNSGTLSAEAQKAEDAKFQHHPAAHPHAKHPFAALDLKHIEPFDGADSMTHVAVEHALHAAPKATSVGTAKSERGATVRG